MSANKIDAFDLSSGVPKIEGTLRPAPKFADRISKRVLMVAFGLVAFVVIIVLVSIGNMDDTKTSPPSEKATKIVPTDKDGESQLPRELKGDVDSQSGKMATSPSLVKQSGKALDAVTATILGEKTDAKVDDKTAKENKGSDVKSGPTGSLVPAIGTVPGIGVIPRDPGVDASGKVAILTPEQQAANLEKQGRLSRMAQARAGGMSAKSFEASETTGAGATIPGMAELLAAAKNGAAQGSPQQANSKSGDTEQDEKLAFIKNGEKDDRGYHPHVPVRALSKNEIKTGAFIPMALQQSINSDLPGQITARVTEDVYDSISGCRMLIPSLSTVVGRYDSKVALGQGRMLVVWNELIFPNGDQLDLAGMQGYDISGEAGLDSDVDNHYLRLFGLTFGLSMITAGVQLSVPQPNPGANGATAPQTPGQTVAAALAQQYGTLGSQIIGKYMAVQPTLRNFADERFIVVVPRTMVFTMVWRNRCVAPTMQQAQAN